ncbi:MAG: MutS-related protein [Candidatus Helarchaeota archaeon]
MKNSVLTSIQGLGPKIFEKLIEHFITEENVINAISEAMISEIASIRGIGRKLALKIIQEFHLERGGIYSNDVLKTNDILKIHQQLTDILQSYAQTQYVKDRFSLLFPLPSTKLGIIKERQLYYKKYISELSEINAEILAKFRLLLKKIKPIKPLDMKNKLKIHRIIITNNKKEYDRLIENDIEKYCKILLVQSFNDKEISFFNSFDLVFFITKTRLDQNLLDNIENLIILKDDWEVSNFIPEIIIGNYIGNNYNIIQTSYELIKILHYLYKKYKIFDEDFENIIMDDLDTFIFNLKLLDNDGSIRPGNNPAYDQYQNIIDNFDGIIADQEIWINESIENEIKKSKTIVDGKQIFNLLQSMDDSNLISLNNLMEILPLNLSTIIDNILSKAREELIEKLNLDDPDSSIVFDIYPQDLNFPIEADNFIIQKLKNKLTKKKKFHEFLFISKIAKNLNQYNGLISQVLKILFKLDELLAIKALIDDYNLQFPDFIETTHGISFKNGTNMFLIRDKEVPVPINYHIGDLPIVFECDTDINNDIIILTGANSGGKTTLLHTISQIVILAQMGLPVPAKANIGAFDEIYYFSKSQGMISSGAFETSIKQFTNAIVSDSPKLVLMDELEAITEPGAAAKVVGSILEMFWESRCTSAVLVSHLAQQIMKIILIPFRIDGIEANGIKNGKLIVDRNPKFNYFAKSMPFFIIKKLFESCTDPDKQKVYKNMMKYFDMDKYSDILNKSCTN